MAIPEAQLETWSHQGSITQSKNTYAAIKRCLDDPNTSYAGKRFEVFLQGSYGNDTNIYAESDVDTVIRLDSVYFYDASALQPHELAAFNADFVPATYTYAQFKPQVLATLQSSFGVADVVLGTKAINIKANASRRSADVVVAAQYLRYYSGALPLRYEPGICFFTSSGNRIVNYPKQHAQNCTAKHQSTNQWFKPMVRILKNLRGRLIQNGAIRQGSAPSYFLEGLLSNVPDDKFGRSYTDTFVEAVNWIIKADRTKMTCANREYYLVRDAAAECWPCADCESFLAAAVALWTNWS